MLFFGRIWRYQKSFWNYLTFRIDDSVCSKRQKMLFDIAKNTFHSCDIYLPRYWVHLNSNSRVKSISYFKKKRENWQSPSSWSWSQLSIGQINVTLVWVEDQKFQSWINYHSVSIFWFVPIKHKWKSDRSDSIFAYSNTIKVCDGRLKMFLNLLFNLSMLNLENSHFCEK